MRGPDDDGGEQVGDLVPSHRDQSVQGRVVRAASRRLISGMVSGIMPGSGGGGWPGRTGGGAWVSVRSLTRAAVMAQMARAAITSTAWRAIAV